MPATSETLALWVTALVCDMGYSRNTARVAVNAVRWQHRLKADAARRLGEDADTYVPPEPPDGLPAWYVMRSDHRMPAVVERGPIRPACRGDLVEVAAACAGAGTAGVRDLAAVVLTYALGVGPAELAQLRLRHVVVADAAFAEVQVDLPGGRQVVLRCADWHGDAAAACPVCVVRRWVGCLEAAGITEGGEPVLRQVTKGRDGRITGGSHGTLGERIRRVVTGVELDMEVTRRPVAALRLGGALEARDGGAGRVEVAARAGYKPDSVPLARHLALPQ